MAEHNPYPPCDLTEVEQVEIASALSFHFEDNAACADHREMTHEIVCAVVTRMLRRRNGAA